MNDHRPILIVGGDSKIGRQLASTLSSAGEQVVATSRRPDPGMVALDLSSDVSQWGIDFQPSAAVLCAAVTSLEHCRLHPGESHQVNVTNTLIIAKSLLSRGCPVVFLSTNLVFDGSTEYTNATAPTCPQTEYGRQKAEAERLLMSFDDNVCVVRLSKVVERDMKLLMGWRESLMTGSPIHPFGDLNVSPVSMDDAIGVIRGVISHGLKGIVQVSGARDVTYAEIASRMANRIGARPELVQPICVANSNYRPEHLPMHTTLDITRLQNELHLQPIEIDSVIEAFLEP